MVDRPRLACRNPGTHLHPELRTGAIGVAAVEYPSGSAFDHRTDLALLTRIAEGLRRLNDGVPEVTRPAAPPIHLAAAAGDRIDHDETPSATSDQEIMMTRASGKSEQPPAGSDDIRLVGLIEIFDIFARYLRKGITNLIESGEFPEPYQEFIGLSVWDRDDVERWIADHPNVLNRLLAMAP
jgi:hypothetical protein